MSKVKVRIPIGGFSKSRPHKRKNQTLPRKAKHKTRLTAQDLHALTGKW